MHQMHNTEVRTGVVSPVADLLATYGNGSMERLPNFMLDILLADFPDSIDSGVTVARQQMLAQSAIALQSAHETITRLSPAQPPQIERATLKDQFIDDNIQNRLIHLGILALTDQVSDKAHERRRKEAIDVASRFILGDAEDTTQPGLYTLVQAMPYASSADRILQKVKGHWTKTKQLLTDHWELYDFFEALHGSVLFNPHTPVIRSGNTVIFDHSHDDAMQKTVSLYKQAFYPDESPTVKAAQRVVAAVMQHRGNFISDSELAFALGAIPGQLNTPPDLQTVIAKILNHDLALENPRLRHVTQSPPESIIVQPLYKPQGATAIPVAA